jgi:hypothetical protein
MCFISTLAFAKTDVLVKPKSIKIVQPAPKFDFEKYKIEVKEEIVYDFQQYSCTATFTVYVTGANGEVLDS